MAARSAMSAIRTLASPRSAMSWAAAPTTSRSRASPLARRLVTHVPPRSWRLGREVLPASARPDGTRGQGSVRVVGLDVTGRPREVAGRLLRGVWTGERRVDRATDVAHARAPGVEAAAGRYDTEAGRFAGQGRATRLLARAEPR